MLELRSRDTLPAMLLFVVSALTIFHFALPSGSSERAETGLLWIAIVFTALLGLSRAFAAEREQGLLDEPFDGLDVEGADLLHAELAARTGVTALVATHDPEALASRATARLAIA